MSNNIKFVCVATEMNLYLPYLLQILPDLVILGLNTQWEGYFNRFKMLQTYFETLKDDDIVCFIDAYDVLPTKNINALHDKFIDFTNKHPSVKMIIGHDETKPLNNFFGNLLFGSVNGIRLNGGTYIGYVKNIKEIITYIINNNTVINDDQVALTQYANTFPQDIYIDINKEFFFVFSDPLQPININNNKHNENNKPCFIHANLNGFLDEFLKTEHNIFIDDATKTKIFLKNIEGVYKKSLLYMSYFFK